MTDVLDRDPYGETDFFFICRRNNSSLSKFMERFNLTADPSLVPFEVVDFDNDQIVFSSNDIEKLTNFLDGDENSSFDMYLLNPDGEHFMFCYRPNSYFVMGLPYFYLEDVELKALLDDFKAIYGWGWSHEPPQETFEEAKEVANAKYSYYKRYRNGNLEPPNAE